MKWVLLDDWGFLLVGWVISAALAARHLRRLNRAALLAWSLVQGVCLGLLAVLDWTGGVALALAVVPLALAWGLRSISAACGTSCRAR